MINVRRRAYDALERIDAGAYPSLALNASLGGLLDDQRRFVSSLIYTTLDNDAEIGALLDAHVKKTMRPVARRVLRLGICQLVFMAVPESAAVNESVNLIKEIGKEGLSGFINGVLRNIAREERKRASGSAPTPKWILDMWTRDYGEEAARLLAQHRRPDGVMIRRNPLRVSEKDFFRRVDEAGIKLAPGALEPSAYRVSDAARLFGSELFGSGLAAVQGEASQWAVRALDARPGQRVLDMCAAPGGKTACIAAYMKNKGQILAWDKHHHRVALIDETLSRLGVTCAESALRDALTFAPEYEGSFDAVLVDAPCSGLGVNKPGLFANKRPEDIRELAALQLELLNIAARYVKPGGALVYSTCTVTKDENDFVADAFGHSHTGFRPDPLGRFLPGGKECGGRLQLFPHMYGTDGFFVARWLA